MLNTDINPRDLNCHCTSICRLTPEFVIIDLQNHTFEVKRNWNNLSEPACIPAFLKTLLVHCTSCLHVDEVIPTFITLHCELTGPPLLDFWPWRGLILHRVHLTHNGLDTCAAWQITKRTDMYFCQHNPTFSFEKTLRLKRIYFHLTCLFIWIIFFWHASL